MKVPADRAAVGSPAPRPCASCPYRRDVASGIWAAHEYAKLPAYDADTARQPMELFLCHQTDGASPHARLCSGWVGCHGTELLALRLALCGGIIDATVMDYRSPLPLFASGAAAAEHGLADLHGPGPVAQRVMNKIRIRRQGSQQASGPRAKRSSSR